MDQKTKNKNQTAPKPPKKITERYLYNSGLYYLKRYTASINHFRFIMNRKIKKSCAHHTDQSFEECQKLLEQTVVKLKELGFLNDDQYAHGMVNSYRKRGVSKKAIIAKLCQKGLDRDIILEKLDIIDTEITTLSDADPELLAATRHAKSKRIIPYSTKDPNDPKEINRSLGSYARAGFSFAVAKKIMNHQDDDNDAPL